MYLVVKTVHSKNFLTETLIFIVILINNLNVKDREKTNYKLMTSQVIRDIKIGIRIIAANSRSSLKECCILN